MKILLIHPNFTKKSEVIGGSEIIAYKTYDMLKAKGYEVLYFAENNQPLYDDEYKYSKFLLPQNSNKTIVNYFYNFEAQKRLEQIIKDFKPDIAHIHIIGQFTHSIIDTLYENKIPAIMTVHDANIVCPTCFAWNKKTQKECCVKNVFGELKCLCKTCSCNNSKISSLLADIKFFIKSLGNYDRKITHYITPSNALKDLMISAGYSKEKITVINNFVTEDYLSEASKENPIGSYFLYSGRLSTFKGIYTLIKAIEILPKEIPLHIAGTGLEYENITRIIKKNSIKNIKMLGYLTQDELKEEYRNCVASIFPSEAFESFGLTNIEAFCFSKPVISTGVGGAKEIVENGVNGYLYLPQNENDLAQKMLILWQNRELAKQMGKNGRNKVLEKYTEEMYLTNLEKLYLSLSVMK